MKPKLKLKCLAPYLPYNINAQYFGILNGKEISIYLSRHDKKCKNIDSEGGCFLDYPVFNSPQEIKGLKSAPIKKISIWKNYIVVEIGVKSMGLKKFYMGNNFDSDFKLILKPISDLELRIRLEFDKAYTDTSVDSEIIDLFCFENTGFTEPLTEIDLSKLPYECAEWMFKNHYDFFGLIKQDLAIDINTLK